MEIKATTVFDEATMNVARKWHWRKFGMMQWLWPLAGLVLIALGIFIVITPSGSVTFGGMMAFSGVYCILRKWIHGIFFLDSLRKSAHFGKSYTWTITEHEIEAHGEGAMSKVAWNQFHETVATPDGLLLYIDKNVYHWIPRKGFSSERDYDEARRIIASATKHRELK